MPNTPVRATAQALPDATELEHDETTSSRVQAFGRAYAHWLTAMARIEAPNFEDDESGRKALAEERTALRALFMVPAARSETVWSKLAIFEISVAKEIGVEPDSILLLGLGAIKCDLARIGIGGGADQ